MMISEQQRALPRAIPGEARSDTRERPSASAQHVKRVIDVVGSALLLLLLSPLLAVCAFLVAVLDGRPLIHRRRVVGKCGEFDAFKFRTMKPNADEILHQDPELRAEFERNFKLKNDPRVTVIGGVLRKFSLDELPQLVNVLLGQMSLVGPRMFTADELPKYGTHQAIVLTMKPGLTGYWQVHGRQSVSYEERVKMDVYYVRHWRLLLDLKILLLTPLKVLQREGAL
jgi:lipopolysaccharide/colanic/teichoic acid biosynthesis glycosyltransferase